VPLHAEGPPKGENEAGIDAGPADPCGPVPPRPPPAADADVDGTVIVLAAYFWGYDDGGQDFLCKESGLNLDGLDSPPPDCAPVACSSLPGGPAKNVAGCDGPNGSDDALAAVISQLSDGLAQDPNTLKAFAPTLALERGVLNLLFQIRGYNGTPSDDDIELAVWTSSGITGLAQPTSFEYQDLQGLPPRWDGGQDVEWTIDERSAKLDGELVLPKIVAHGYVTDGILVVPSTGPLSLPPLVGTPIGVQDGILMGRLFREAGRWQLTDGRLATRVESAEFLNVVGASRLTSNGQLCSPASALYALLRADVCASLDLPADGGAPDAATRCGALSLAFTIASVESKIATRTGAEGLQTFVTGKSGFHGRPPCEDDAGTIWCDDCAWPSASRCPPPPP
jgi:hypothetical protein